MKVKCAARSCMRLYVGQCVNRTAPSLLLVWSRSFTLRGGTLWKSADVGVPVCSLVMTISFLIMSLSCQES